MLAMARLKAREFGLQLFLLVFVCLSPVFVSGGLVIRTNTVTVRMGRTVYLNTDDIVVKKMKKSDEGCRIEVVQNDPITQRVGKLEPKVSHGKKVFTSILINYKWNYMYMHACTCIHIYTIRNNTRLSKEESRRYL